MTQFFKILFGFFGSVIDLLDGVAFELYGVNVTFASVIFALLGISIIISVMWKGAKA